MKNGELERLKKVYIKKQLLNQSNIVYVDWAVSELLNGVNNENICILASFNPNETYEIERYLDIILSNKPQINSVESYEVIGEIIVKLRAQYFKKDITITEMDQIISQIFVATDYLDWLVMLARNCEYATDIDVFLNPFEDELNYIANLWEDNIIYSKFIDNYNRDISNKHDFSSYN